MQVINTLMTFLETMLVSTGCFKDVSLKLTVIVLYYQQISKFISFKYIFPKTFPNTSFD